MECETWARVIGPGPFFTWEKKMTGGKFRPVTSVFLQTSIQKNLCKTATQK